MIDGSHVEIERPTKQEDRKRHILERRSGHLNINFVANVGMIIAKSTMFMGNIHDMTMTRKDHPNLEKHFESMKNPKTRRDRMKIRIDRGYTELEKFPA